MPMLTLGGAAQASGKAKSSLLAAIRDGRLSASRDDKGQWSIDPAELFRAFPERSAEHQAERDRPPVIVQKTDAEHLLDREREFHARERAILEDVIADLRRRLDDEASERRRLTALLTHVPATQPPDPAPAAPPAVEPERHPAPPIRPFLVFLLSLLIATAMVVPPKEMARHLADWALGVRAYLSTW